MDFVSVKLYLYLDFKLFRHEIRLKKKKKKKKKKKGNALYVIRFQTFTHEIR